jgi:hypothetical protein
MRRLIALTVAIALALPMIIAFGPAPARADNGTATNVALGLAAFAVFNQLLGPRPVQVEYRPEAVYRPEPAYRQGPVYREPWYREGPGYGRGQGYRRVPGHPRVVPYPHGRYEFRDDGYRQGRWVWIPYGRHPAPPVPHFPLPPFHR